MAEDVQITGKVATFPGEVKTITLVKGTSVADAISTAGFGTIGGGQTVKLNGVKLNDLDGLGSVEVEEDGFSITITGQVKGNG